MIQKKMLHSLGAALLLLTSASWAADTSGLYMDLKLVSGQQSIGTDQRVSPRQNSLLSGADSASFGNGSISIGQKLGAGYRAEAEYSFPKSAEYTSYWTPFNANANVFQVQSQRLMLNAYKDFPLSSQWSANLSVGLGAAFVKAKGWQGNTGRYLYENSETKLAASIGAGAEYAVTPDWKLGFGYRYIHMGNIKSGVNDYSTLAYNKGTGVGVQDETMRGKLREHNLFVSLRKDF